MIVTNKNLLSLTGFKLSLDGRDFDNVAYFAVSASFPSISLNEVSTPYRNLQGFVPSERLSYDPLTIRIAIDEELHVYQEILNWMLYNTQNTPLKTVSGILSFLTSHNNVSRQVQFFNMFPTNIGSVEFNTQSNDVEYAYVDVSFRYDYFQFI